MAGVPGLMGARVSHSKYDTNVFKQSILQGEFGQVGDPGYFGAKGMY